MMIFTPGKSLNDDQAKGRHSWCDDDRSSCIYTIFCPRFLVGVVLRRTRNRPKNALRSAKSDRDASKHLTQHQQHLINEQNCHQSILSTLSCSSSPSLNIMLTRYWTYVKEEKVNCFLKGGKAETVRKPKHVSGSISKVLCYWGEFVSHHAQRFLYPWLSFCKSKAVEAQLKL